jgi:hypothetical protein
MSLLGISPTQTVLDQREIDWKNAKLIGNGATAIFFFFIIICICYLFIIIGSAQAALTRVCGQNRSVWAHQGVPDAVARDRMRGEAGQEGLPQPG